MTTYVLWPRDEIFIYHGIYQNISLYHHFNFLFDIDGVTDVVPLDIGALSLMKDCASVIPFNQAFAGLDSSQQTSTVCDQQDGVSL